MQDAVNKAIGAVVRTRPPDPFVFIAQKLREVRCKAGDGRLAFFVIDKEFYDVQVNQDIKLAKREQEEAAIVIQRRSKGIRDRKKAQALKMQKEEKKEHDEQEAAAVKIQSISRRKKDKQKVEQLKTNNQVWLRELHRKMCQHAKEFLDPEMANSNLSEDINAAAITQGVVVDGEEPPAEVAEGGEVAAAVPGPPTGDGGREVPARALLAFVAKDAEGIAKLLLPERFLNSVPKQYSGMFKKIKVAIEEGADLDASYTWPKFASFFGVTAQQADHADLEASAVRIQALGRKRRDQHKALERKRAAMEGASEEGKEGVMGYTVDTQAAAAPA